MSNRGVDLIAASSDAVRRELGAIQRAAGTAEHGYEETLTEIRNEIDQAQANRSSSEHDDEAYLEHLADSANQLERHRATILRPGMLMALYASFERYLVRTCQLFHKHDPSFPEPDDPFERFGLAKAKSYLNGNLSLTVFGTSNYWENVCRIQELRHAFAHRRGWLTDDELKGSLGAYIKGTPQLEIRNKRQVLIGEAFLIIASSTFVGFVEDLTDNLPSLNS